MYRFCGLLEPPMPRRVSLSPPSYRFHKARNCAVVTINGRNHYLGAHGSPGSHEKYARLIAEWRRTNWSAQSPNGTKSHADISINELLLAYWRFATNYYSRSGKPTKELTSIRDAIRPLRELY